MTGQLKAQLQRQRRQSSSSSSSSSSLLHSTHATKNGYYFRFSFSYGMNFGLVS